MSEWPNDLTTREEAIARANRAMWERDAAYAVLGRIVRGWDGPPHKLTFQRAVADARALLAKRGT